MYKQKITFYVIGAAFLSTHTSIVFSGHPCLHKKLGLFHKRSGHSISVFCLKKQSYFQAKLKIIDGKVLLSRNLHILYTCFTGCASW